MSLLLMELRLQGCLKYTVRWGVRRRANVEGHAKPETKRPMMYGVALVCFRPFGHEGKCRRRLFGVQRTLSAAAAAQEEV